MWANEHAHTLLTIYSFSRESFMADRTGLDSTMLHYLAVQRAMVSVNRPVHSNFKRRKAGRGLGTRLHSGWKFKIPYCAHGKRARKLFRCTTYIPYTWSFLHSQTKLMLCLWPLGTIVPRLLFLTYSITHYKNI